MKEQYKKIWRKNFEIENCSYFMATPAIAGLIYYQSKTVGKKILRELVWVQKDYKNIGSYVLASELRRLIKKTIEVMIRDPELINNIHKKAYIDNKKYFNFAKSVLEINLSKLTNNELGKLHKKITDHQKISHAYSNITTWWLDSDGEDFSKFLLNKLARILKEKKSNFKLAETFSILTTPEKPSLAIKEEIESLKILKEINYNKQVKRIFLQKDVEKIKADLDKINIKLKRKIIRHYKKWLWTPFTYIGPVYELDYYLQIWSGLLRQKFNINRRLDELINYSKDVEEQKRKIIRELQINQSNKKIFNIAADIIRLKAYRKNCLFHGMYVLDKILKEVARRLNLSIKQVRFMADWEMAPALKRGGFPADILNERIKFSVYYQKDDKGIIYAGERAKKFLAKLNLEKEKIKKTNYLEGTSACSGKVSGRVKIVNLPEEMDKMNQGDIMVAHTTFPSLVPAMKKAAAIITDDGGITCHAAIVARELKTPCVVGVRIATKVLKDGDRVEVDAERGIVRKF